MRSGLFGNDDSDNSDRAGRIAHNKSNNLRELVDRKLARAQRLCPYWPRAEYRQCTNNAVRCLLEPLADEGELSDHLNVRGSCDDGSDAGSDANGESRGITIAALKLERRAKKECHDNDDECKNNVECQFLADTAAKYPEVVRLVDCPQIDLENWTYFETDNDDDDEDANESNNDDEKSADDDDDAKK